ncbi:MAG: transporter, permease protein, partial [Firmicutes bacterium]|nr:transporter, permease protein [Bacillota bacterium]
MRKSGPSRNYGERLCRMLFALAFWILIWELVSVWVGQEILLASPVAVFQTLFVLIQSLDFWRTILFSSLRIVTGFVLALIAGTLLAALSYRFRLAE